MLRKERLTQRNQQVRKYFYSTKEKNPKWRLDAVIDAVAAKFFLSSRTVDAIISYEGIYKDVAINTASTSQLKIF